MRRWLTGSTLMLLLTGAMAMQSITCTIPDVIVIDRDDRYCCDDDWDDWDDYDDWDDDWGWFDFFLDIDF